MKPALSFTERKPRNLSSSTINQYSLGEPRSMSLRMNVGESINVVPEKTRNDNKMINSTTY